MRVIVTPRAETDIDHHYEWGVARFGDNVAKATFGRVRRFIELSLEAHPRAGKHLPDRNLYEAWIPRTPFVIFYRLDEAAETVWVLALFHTSQDRSDFDPG
jgi:plasmid stabilization system protein ParE